MSEFYNDQHFSNLDCAETVASALFPDLTTTYSSDLPYQYPVPIPPIVTNPSNPTGEYGYNSQPSRPSFDDYWNTSNQSSDLTGTYSNDLPVQCPVTFPPIATNSSYPSEEYASNFQYSSFDESNTPNQSSDLTGTYSNDLPEQYPVTFPPIVTDSSHPSEEYESNFQASRHSFDERWNTPNEFSDLTATYSNDLPDQYPVTFSPIVTNSSYPSEEYGSNFQSSFFDESNTPCPSSESPQDNQQFSTSCPLISSFLAPSPTPSIAAPVASEVHIPNLDIFPPKGFSMISLWKKLTIPGKNMFIRIFNSLELDDDKKREYLERMEIQEEVKAHMDSSEDIAKQMDDQTAFVPNLDARPPERTVIITTDLLSRNEENRQNLTYKGMCLTQQMFATLVLRRTQLQYYRLLKRTKSWESLIESGKKVYVRIYNWLELDDDQKREYLEIMEIKEELKKVVESSEEMAKQNKIQIASIANLDARLPVGTTMNTADLLSRTEESRRNLTYKGKSLPQHMFATMVLRRTQGQYARLLKEKKPWESLIESGKNVYVRMFNWLELDDEKKREYLEIMKIQMNSIEDKREICKCLQCCANFSEIEIEAAPLPSSSVSSNTSLINLNASLPNRVSINTADILNACESSRRRFKSYGKILSQKTFAELVLQRTQAYYSNICKNPKPWESLTKKGKSSFVRIYNWIQLNNEDKRTYLEMMEKMEEQPAKSEKKKTLTKCTEFQQKMKRKRGAKTKFTEYQEKTLEAVFQRCNYPTMLFKRNLAKKLDLPFAVIQRYFFNHRQRK
ncbi:unnamed protein product [Caenorhabditis nigoni]